MAELGINLPTLLAQTVNFLLLLGLLYLLLYKPVLRVLDQRSERIKESLETADRVRQESEQQQQEMQQQIEEARQEGQKLIEEARQLADRYRDEEREKARSDAEALLTKARSEIQRERDSAVEEVRRQFADLAISAAEQVIERSLDAKAHQELIDKVLQEGTVSKRS